MKSRNQAQGPVPALRSPQDNQDSINLLDWLDTVIEQRWIIASVTALALALGGGYGMMATPIYEANTLIQVEEGKAGGLGLAELNSTFETKTPASAEMEILRSRLVMGQAASNLNLALTVTPKYLPLVGRWLARHATAPSTPGFLGFSGYIKGNESLQVAHLKGPKSLNGQKFSVLLTTQGYILISPSGDPLGKGQMGEPLAFNFDGQSASVLVASAVGMPGAVFYVTSNSLLRVTEKLQRDIKLVEQGKQSGVITASLEGDNPALTANILNEVGSLYVSQNVERKAAEAEKAIRFLNTQLPQLRLELEASESKFNQFRNQNGTFDLGAEAGALLGQAVGLRVKLLELQQKRKEVDARFTSQHPSVQVLDAQIKEISAQLEGVEHKSRTFPNVEQDLLRMTRDVKVNNELYTSLLNSFQQLRLVKEGKVGNVRIVDVAAVPESPIRPQRAALLATSGLLGLLAGLCLAFVRSSLHPGIKNAEDIERHIGLNVFATVPHSKQQAGLTNTMNAEKYGNHLLVNKYPEDPGIEGLRSLRTALQFAMLDASNNIVLITGPSQGIGKSFISTNFAGVLGAGGKRVLIIDADMRKGHIHKSFGLVRGHGLSELITGSQNLDQVIRKDVSAQLDLITTGTLPPNPAELLMSPVTAQILKFLSSQYDLVLIDTPPVLAVSDTQVLAPLVGAVFLVARAELSTLGELQETSKRLGQAGVAVRGVIFNDVNIHKRRYGYGNGYGYK
jgi:tyrosine-protein kinase Etk/Wzc